MTMPQDLITYLQNDAALAALVGTRIYPNRLPQTDTPAQPGPMSAAITYMLVSDGTTQAHDFGTLRSFGRYQFDCYAATYLQASAVASALYDALTTWKQHDPTHCAYYENGVDDDEPELNRNRRTLDFMIESIL